MDYLLSWNYPVCDLLLPLDNHDRRPVGKEDLAAAPYGAWLIEAFDHWMSRSTTTRIRFFEFVIRRLVGAPSLVESLGLHPVAIAVIESDGSVEAVDALKTAYDGGAYLGYSVFDHAFDDVAGDQRHRHAPGRCESLCAQCQTCDLLDQCGGGYLPHRFSTSNGYINPSVYCSDLMALFRHVDGHLRNVLAGASARSTSRPR